MISSEKEVVPATALDRRTGSTNGSDTDCINMNMLLSFYSSGLFRFCCPLSALHPSEVKNPVDPHAARGNVELWLVEVEVRPPDWAALGLERW